MFRLFLILQFLTSPLFAVTLSAKINDLASSMDSIVSIEEFESEEESNPFLEPIPCFTKPHQLRNYVDEHKGTGKKIIVDIDVILTKKAVFPNVDDDELLVLKVDNSNIDHWDFEGVHHLFVKAKHAYDFTAIMAETASLESIMVYLPDMDDRFYKKKRLVRFFKGSGTQQFFNLDHEEVSRVELRNAHRRRMSCANFVFYLLCFDNIPNNVCYPVNKAHARFTAGHFHRTWVLTQSMTAIERKSVSDALYDLSEEEQIRMVALLSDFFEARNYAFGEDEGGLYAMLIFYLSKLHPQSGKRIVQTLMEQFVNAPGSLRHICKQIILGRMGDEGAANGYILTGLLANKKAREKHKQALDAVIIVFDVSSTPPDELLILLEP